MMLLPKLEEAELWGGSLLMQRGNSENCVSTCFEDQMTEHDGSIGQCFLKLTHSVAHISKNICCTQVRL